MSLILNIYDFLVFDWSNKEICFDVKDIFLCLSSNLLSKYLVYFLASFTLFLFLVLYSISFIIIASFIKISINVVLPLWLLPIKVVYLLSLGLDNKNLN